jgi:hypothetical protein
VTAIAQQEPDSALGMLAKAMVEFEESSRVRRYGGQRVRELVHVDACKRTMALSERRMFKHKMRTVRCKREGKKEKQRRKRKEGGVLCISERKSRSHMRREVKVNGDEHAHMRHSFICRYITC